ncbi:uncharacterized protein EV420DRAFT_1518490 [Desarmillaria tabescens]|uniref:Uncharacterized protein n=1 Tax=Armillaria tabescens TaxID=1929756 RepID=A0AA39T4B1_ARMTA|nr:uncharacterized protein EV420DRAFT_1518490 [Desarmillaria tabescens]KAK0463496.1 hypothetical protein EV420DRAFT_1518490 [Desarmillaria tabescens]
MSYNPYNPGRVYEGGYSTPSQSNPNQGPPVFNLNWYKTSPENRPHEELFSGPDRHPRSRVRPEASGSNYHASRASSSQAPPRPVTPPPSSVPYYGPPGPQTPPRKYSIEHYKTIMPPKWKVSPGKREARVTPDKPVQLVAYVSHRNSLVPTDENGKPLPPKLFIFNPGRQINPQTPCDDQCAHFQFMHQGDFKVKKAEKVVVVQQPGPIPTKSATFISFVSRGVVVDFPGQNPRGCGVLLRDVLDPPEGFSVVDDSKIVNPFGAEALLLNINVNGYPIMMETINMQCQHGCVTRYGILKAVAQLYHRIMHMSFVPTGEPLWRNKALPKKIRFENIRLVSLYTFDRAIWNAEYIFVSPKKPKRAD